MTRDERVESEEIDEYDFTAAEIAGERHILPHLFCFRRAHTRDRSLIAQHTRASTRFGHYREVRIYY